MTDASRNLLLHGATSPPPELRLLRAGPVVAMLDGVDLRYVRIAGTELVRRVYVAVRDRNWNTIGGHVSELDVVSSDDGFEVRFEVRHTSHDVEFSWLGEITGESSGRITYGLDGRAEQELVYNRIGLCVHHPWRESAGRPVRARTPDGEVDGEFPTLIGRQRFEGGTYHPLFPSFDRLELDLAGGGSLLFEFEGDLWETEDHRNWTDANFKTYSTPVSQGIPHELAEGEPLRQRLTITPSGFQAESDGLGGQVRLTIGGPTGTRVPAIGLGSDQDRHRLAPRDEELLRALSPAHLRVEVRLARAGWREELDAARETAVRIGSHLELSVHLRPEHADALGVLADALAPGPPVDRVLVILDGGRSGTPEETTPPELLEAVRDGLGDAVSGAAFVGGTEMYFAEINRTRPDPSSWDGVCFSITPQIHAFADVDLVETLDAQGETVRSALAFSQGKSIVVSPVTIARRVNFHATGPEPEPPAGEPPASVDARQPSLLGAAWTAASAKYLAEAGASSVTYFETTGWHGVLERAAGSPLPDRFRSRPGEVFPLYHALADAAEWRDADVLECRSDDPLAAVGLAVRTGDGAVRFLLANLTHGPQAVELGPLQGGFLLRRLDESTAALAGADPASFRASAGQASADGRLSVELRPYELVRIDPAG